MQKQENKVFQYVSQLPLFISRFIGIAIIGLVILGVSSIMACSIFPY